MIIFFPIFNAIAANTPIEQVVVYSDRAQVTRTGTTSCSNGQANIEFRELPKLLLSNTLRASSSTKAEVIGIEIENETLAAPLNKDVAKLEEEMEKIAREKSVIQADIQIISQRKRTLEQYQSYFSKQLKTELLNTPNTKQWTENLDTLQEEYRNIFKKTQDLKTQLEKKNERLGLLEEQKRRLRQNPQRDVIHANVLLQCKEGSVSSSLSYVIPQATWKPEYDLQYIHQDQKTYVRTAVIVRQSTGEDWKNAKIILSTANPQLGARAPYPTSILVHGQLKTEPKQLLSKAEDQSRLAGGGGSIQESSVNISDQGNMLEMELPKKVDIISNGHPYWLPLDEHAAKTKAKLTTTPKLAPFVYQTVSFFNPSPYPILPGNIQVQRNGTYIGLHPMSYTAPQEPIEVSLGTDSRFRVEYEPIVQKKKGQKLFDPNQYLNKAFRISITNLTDQKQRIEVRDQIPISKHEKILVSLGKETTSGYRLDEDQGFLFWDLTLEPNKEKELLLYYQIQLPEEWK